MTRKFIPFGLLAIIPAFAATGLLQPTSVQSGDTAQITYTVKQLSGAEGFVDMKSAAAGINCIARKPTAAPSANAGRTIRSEAHRKYIEMATQLCKDTGLNLRLVSDYRSAADQRTIWNGKKANIASVARQRGCIIAPSGSARQRSIALCILKFNSMPGTSRHHWGTDVDFNSLNGAAWANGTNAQIKLWLDKNAATYGFCQPFAGKAAGTRKFGYSDEAWHWSYMPLAADMLKQYEARVTDKDIIASLGGLTSGLSEADVAALNIRAHYVGSIAQKCREWKS